MVTKTRPVGIARSVACPDGDGLTGLAEFHRWFREFGRQAYARTERVPLTDLVGWTSDPDTGIIGHHSGQFFTVEGIDIRLPDGPVPQWSQPIINQPEVGILGILVKEFGGTLHCLIQAKAEPGNLNGAVQLAPTVQATYSNYTRAHGGKSVPYVEYFLDTSRHRLLVDVRQSEHGSCYVHKRSRNMVVEVIEDVEVLPGFCWLTLGQVHQLLGVDDLVNVYTRSVLSCLSFAGVHPAHGRGGDDFHRSLIRSYRAAAGSRHSIDEILSWITSERTRIKVYTSMPPLRDLPGWRRTDQRISHESGRFFDVIGIRVTASGREMSQWTQPMIEPHGLGVVAFLVRCIGGLLHALVHARVEAGCLDVLELAPTVQCIPENYGHLPAAARPRFLDEVLSAGPDRIRFEAVLSEPGGRLYQARSRHLIVESEVDESPEYPDFRWMTVHQLVDLLRHSNYLNVQARSLVCCLHSLSCFRAS